jgi:hypothetical protein
MFSIHPHIEAHIPTEAHVNAGASSHPSGPLNHLGEKPSASNLTFVKVAGDANNYVITDTSNTRTPQQLFVKSNTGNLKQTTKMGVYDGLGGVRLDNGLPGGVGGSSNKQNHDAIQAYRDAHNRYSSSTRGNLYSPSPTASHSFSERGAWNSLNTTSYSAPPLPPKKAASSHTASFNALPLPPRNAATSSNTPPRPPKSAALYSSPTNSHHPSSYNMGPAPDPRYLKDSGDGQSKYWYIPDGKGGSKPADSSIDRYGQPVHVSLNGPAERQGKGSWIGPHSSVIPPPTKEHW